MRFLGWKCWEKKYCVRLCPTVLLEATSALVLPALRLRLKVLSMPPGGYTGCVCRCTLLLDGVV